MQPRKQRAGSTTLGCRQVRLTYLTNVLKYRNFQLSSEILNAGFRFNRNDTILAMITTKKELAWPGDSQISNYTNAGLRLPCLVRFKLFTLDNRLLQKRLGYLSGEDSNQIEKQASFIWQFTFSSFRHAFSRNPERR